MNIGDVVKLLEKILAEKEKPQELYSFTKSKIEDIEREFKKGSIDSNEAFEKLQKIDSLHTLSIRGILIKSDWEEVEKIFKK